MYQKQVSIFINNLFENWENISNKKTAVEGSKFLLNSLDDSINFVEEFSLDGKTKKEIVIYIAATLFDEIIAKSLPFYLIPFNKLIRIFLLKLVIDTFIDFIVQKYKTGSWKYKKGVL
jgi:hypothetical protein